VAALTALTAAVVTKKKKKKKKKRTRMTKGRRLTGLRPGREAEERGSGEQGAVRHDLI